MDYLTKDTSYVLAMMLDSKSLLNMCQANKRFYEWVCKNENFWKEKMGKDYPFLLKFKPREQSYQQFYLEMVYYIAKIEEKYGIPYMRYNPKYFFKSKYSHKIAFDEAMKYAAREGYMDIVKLMIEKGSTKFNYGLLYAAEGGHMEIVKFMIEKGATNFNWAISEAVVKGHINIVKLMIEKGATDFTSALCNAAYGGHLDIVKLMIEKGTTNYNNAMDYATVGGHMDIVEYLKSFY